MNNIDVTLIFKELITLKLLLQIIIITIMCYGIKELWPIMIKSIKRVHCNDEVKNEY